ncbi:MAG: hypothetical protein RBQ97_00645 [Acholeplasma sp.]|nr:hypothetical protein [Acholeplasma sp.]
MSKFLRDFKKRFTGTLGLIIVIILAGYLVYSNLSFSGGFFEIIRYAIPYVVFGIAIIIAVLKGKYLLAYLVLLIQYSGAAWNFMHYLFRFNFSGGFPWHGLVAFLVFIFLALQVISHAFDSGSSSKAPWTNVAVTIFIAFIVTFYFVGFNTTLFILLLPIIGYIGGSPLISSLFLLNIYIESPFTLYDLIKNKSSDTEAIILTIFGIMFLILSIYHVIDRFKKEQITK